MQVDEGEHPLSWSSWSWHVSTVDALYGLTIAEEAYLRESLFEAAFG